MYNCILPTNIIIKQFRQINTMRKITNESVRKTLTAFLSETNFRKGNVAVINTGVTVEIVCTEI